MEASSAGKRDYGGKGRLVKYWARLGCWISPCYGPFSLGGRFETYEPFISLIFQLFSGPRWTAYNWNRGYWIIGYGAHLCVCVCVYVYIYTYIYLYIYTMKFNIYETTQFHIPLCIKYSLPICCKMFLLLITAPTYFGHNSRASSGIQRVYRLTQHVWNYAEEMYLHPSVPHKLPHKLCTSINLLTPWRWPRIVTETCWSNNQ
jgi:hypothetical protein